MTALDMIKSALAGLNYTIFTDRAVDDSGTVPPQYVVLGGPATGRPDDEVLSGPAQDTAVDLRVTAVVGTPAGVRIMLDRVRGLLSPGLRSADFTATGFRVSTRFVRSELVDVDTSVTITGTNRHPAYGVDTYRLVTEVTA